MSVGNLLTQRLITTSETLLWKNGNFAIFTSADCEFRTKNTQTMIDTRYLDPDKARIKRYHGSLNKRQEGVIESFKRTRKRFIRLDMKGQIQDIIKEYESCLRESLVKLKLDPSIIIIDTAREVFKLVYLDVIGRLPLTRNGNKHILIL